MRCTRSPEILRDDLRPCRPVAAARVAPERAAVFGDFQLGPDRVLRDFRAGFSYSPAGAVGARDHRGSHEAGRAPAPGGGGGDPPARPAAGLSALSRDVWQGLAKKPVHGALIRPPAMLSTDVNPTDGLRFDRDADRFS